MRTETKRQDSQPFIPCFVAFINEIIYVSKRCYCKFSEVFNIWTQHWMFSLIFKKTETKKVPSSKQIKKWKVMVHAHSFNKSICQDFLSYTRFPRFKIARKSKKHPIIIFKDEMFIRTQTSPDSQVVFSTRTQ